MKKGGGMAIFLGDKTVREWLDNIVRPTEKDLNFIKLEYFFEGKSFISFFDKPFEKQKKILEECIVGYFSTIAARSGTGVVNIIVSGIVLEEIKLELIEFLEIIPEKSELFFKCLTQDILALAEKSCNFSWGFLNILANDVFIEVNSKAFELLSNESIFDDSDWASF